MKGKVGILLLASAVTVPVVASGATLDINDVQNLPGSAINPTLQERSILENSTITAQTPAVQALVQQLQPALTQRQQEVTVTFEATKETYPAVLEAAMTYIFQQDEYLNYDYSGHKSSGSIMENKITLNLIFSYKQTPEQEQYVQAAVKEIVAQETNASMTKHEKIKALYDYVVRNLKYDTSMSQAVNAPYFALTGGKTLCNGYAMLMYRLLNEVGIETRLISGTVETQGQAIGHAWNLVNLDGQWYHLDATWGDPIPDQGDKVNYDYYMITDEQIAKDHYWEDGGINKREKPYPEANTSYFDTLNKADEILVLKGIKQWVAPQLLANSEATYIESLKFQMDRLLTNVEILYLGNDVDYIKENMGNYVNKIGQYSGGYFRYNPLNITYQNNVVARFKYDFPDYSMSINSIDLNNIATSIAVDEVLPLVVTMERSDGEQFDVTDLATVEVSNPEVVKVYHDRLVGLTEGTTKVTAQFNGKSVTEQLVVEEADLIVEPQPEPEPPRDVIPYPFTGYKSFGEKTNVPKMKVWTIHMSQIVTDAIKPQIVVTNQYGDIVETTVDVIGKKIIVQPPSAGYESGETYYLKATYGNAKLNMSSKFTIE